MSCVFVLVLEQHKVFNSVVILATGSAFAHQSMMHNFFASEVAPKVLFHHETMLKNATVLPSLWVIRSINCYVSKPSHAATARPIW